MRRLFLLFVGFLASVSMFAEGVDKTQALRKAQRFMPGKTFLESKSVSKARGDASGEAFYIFNADRNGGFVIVSGDDRTPEILGYSRSGNLDMDKMPENMKWWLEGYAKQMEAIGSGSLVPSAKSSTRSVMTAIPAMIKTQWGQNGPFNLMCPDENYVDYNETGYDPDKRCLTGCVATALAQILYHYQKPSGCPAIASYPVGTYDENWNFTQTGTINGIPATTFEWDKMKTTYSSDETGESAYAVAKLMRYCGQAMSVYYGVDGSSGYIDPSTLASVFNFSKNIRELSRDNYTTSQWETIIYDELAASRPVLYSGQDKQGEGHQFIVDGYDGSGLFHINWGWAGFKDAYFVLSIADPDRPGTDAGATDKAYKLGQYALIGVKPAEDGEVMLPIISGNINPEVVTVDTYTRDNASMDFSLVVLKGYIYARYRMEPKSDVDFEYGWGLYQDDQFVRLLGSESGMILKSQWWWNNYENLFTESFGAGLTEGRYHITQIYRLQGETEWKRCDDYGANSYVAEVTATSLTVRLADPGNSSFTVNSMATLTDKPEVGSPVELKVNITNNADSERLVFNLWSKKEGTENWVSVKGIAYYVDPGKTEDILISYTPNEAGTFTLKLTDNSSDEAELGTTTVSVVATETVIIDGVRYFCTPAYGVAKVIGREYSEDMLSSLTIRSTVSASGVDCQVKEISGWAFQSFWNVRSLVIPEGVETIGDYAFSYMGYLTKLELPASLKSVGEFVINGDTQLAAVISRINNPSQVTIDENTFSTSQWNDGVESLIPSSATLYVPIGTKAKYEAIPAWTQFAGIEEGEIAESVVGGLRYSYSTGGTTATVIQDDSYKTLEEVSIPATVNIGSKTYTVTAIGDNAFQGCRNLTSVLLPEGLVSIGNNAFQNISVSEITFPNTLKKIGAHAFEDCNNITTIVIPEGVETIGENAFSYIWKLSKLELPASLKSIGRYVITYDSQLETVVSRINNPSQVTIDENAFSQNLWNGSTWEIKPSSATLYVPVGTKPNYEAITAWTQFANIVEGELMEATDGVLRYSYLAGGNTATVIYDDSYMTLTNVVIPATITVKGTDYFVTAIGNNAFYECENLQSVTISDGITVIGNRAFEGVHDGDTEFTLPSTLTTIGENAFWNVNGLKTLILPDGLESIGNSAFAYCNGLTEVELPATLTSIGQRVFVGDGSLSSVRSKIESPMAIDESAFAVSSEWDESNNTYINEPTSAVLYVPEGKKGVYESTPGWNMFSAIEEGTPFIYSDGILKYSCSPSSMTATLIQDAIYQELTNVEIPATITVNGVEYHVKTIGNAAFQDCRNLQSVVLHEGLETIGNFAFQSSSVSEINLPSTLKKIGESAFQNCWNVETIVVPDGVETVGNMAFYCMGSLTRIELPASLKSLGYSVISDNQTLTEVISHITDPFMIDSSVFGIYHWNNETGSFYTPSPYTLYVPAGTKDKYQAIPGWTMFAGIEEGEPFDYTSLILKFRCSPDSKTAILIHDDAYSGITQVNIPATIDVNGDVYRVKAIGTRAFADCWQLTKVILPEGIVSIGTNAFSWTELSSINFPSMLKTIRNNAFWDCEGLTSVELPEGLETIESYAFAECSNLENLVIPSTVTTIGWGVIMYDESLATVTSRIINPYAVEDGAFYIKDEWIEETQSSIITPPTATLYVPGGKRDVYRNLNGWSVFQNIEEYVLSGDANGDGNVDNDDIDAIVGYIMGGNTENFVFKNADVTDDDKVNVADVVKLVDMLK